MHSLISTLLRRIRFVRYSIRAIGWRKLVGSSLALAADPDARNHDSGFDGRFGTDTTTSVTPGDASIPDPRRDGATAYLPTMDIDLAAMLDELGWPAALTSRATFVDIGSGKGRVVLLAAMRQFREVIGVELSPSLHAIAERNVELVAAHGALQSPVRLVSEDATEFAIPEGALILYLYHPFREDVASAFIDHVVASVACAPRPVAIIYGHPMLQPCLDPAVFQRGDVFRKAADGGRSTRGFRIGWSIWTNLTWLAIPHARAA